jgi:hypothetical protein
MTPTVSRNGHLDPPPAHTPLGRVVATFQRHLHLPDPRALYTVLAAAVANRTPGDPVWLMLVGAPSSGKTELLYPLERLSGVHMHATITVPGLLSGTKPSEADSGATGGLLRAIGPNGTLVLKDFTSILSMNEKARTELLGALREIYDGHWKRALGVDGGKTLEWHGKLGLLAACTEPSWRRWVNVSYCTGCRLPRARPRPTAR